MLRYKEIKKQLSIMIAELQPGEPLPSREALCEMLNSSYATVHKAVQELVREGELYTRQGSGTYVTGNKPESQESHVIGILIPNNTQIAYRSLIHSIEKALSARHAGIMLAFTDGDGDLQNRKLSQLLSHHLSGVIIIPAFNSDLVKDYVLHTRLQQYQVPAVFCYRGVEGMPDAPMIGYNNFYMGYLATKHLISKGYRHIIYMSEYMLRTTTDRYQGYVTAMIENGLEIQKEAIVLKTLRDGRANEYEDMCRILKSGCEVDAVFCTPEYLVPGVCRAIRDCGKRISDDVGVITVDNSDVCYNESPQITSLGGMDEEIGQRAADTLWRMIQGESVDIPFYLVLPSIYERGSCLGPK